MEKVNEKITLLKFGFYIKNLSIQLILLCSIVILAEFILFYLKLNNIKTESFYIFRN